MRTFVAAAVSRRTRTCLAALFIGLFAAAFSGCNSTSEPSLRNELATMRLLRGYTDPESVGSLDSTAPPANLNDYRRARSLRILAAKATHAKLR